MERLQLARTRIPAAAEAMHATSLAGFAFLISIVAIVPGNVLLVQMCYVLFLLLAIRATIKTSKALQVPAFLTIASCLALLIPCGSVLIMISVEAKLREFFKELGISVGIIGPDRQEIAEAMREP
jgi:hypothetical protein